MANGMEWRKNGAARCSACMHTVDFMIVILNINILNFLKAVNLA